MLESFVPQQPSLETVDVVTEIAVKLCLGLFQVIPSPEMSLQQLVGRRAVFTVRTFPLFTFTLDCFLVAHPQVLVEEGAGDGGEVTMRTFEILFVTFYKFDLRCLVRVPPGRMYLEIFLVRADILTQFTRVFQTFVDPLVMAGQLLLRSCPEITFITGQTFSIVDILSVKLQSFARLVVPAAFLTIILPLLGPLLLHSPLGVRLRCAPLLPLTGHAVFLQQVSDEVTLERCVEVTQLGLTVVHDPIVNLIGVHQHCAPLLGCEGTLVTLVPDALVFCLLVSGHIQTIFRPEVAALELTPDNPLLVRSVGRLSRLKFLPGILRPLLDFCELPVARGGLAPSLLTSSPSPD